MSVSIIRGTNDKPVSSAKLDEIFSSQTGLFGQLFIGYPIINTPEGGHPIDALLISADKGIVVFDLIEGTDAGNYGMRQDNSANKLDARLRTHSELMRRRELLIPIHPISFVPGIKNIDAYVEDDYPLVNDATSLMQKLEAFTWKERNVEVYEKALSAMESISTIRQGRTSRTINREDSRGAKLKRLEDSIATLDRIQSKAVIETVEGVQRIRGLAGSGKTIVLALKAAYLHALHPDWRIAITFNTRSLKGQFRRLIYNFSLEQTGKEPDWENMRILNGWGAPGGVERDGIYYEFCREHNVEYFDFGAARRRFARGKEFSGVCEHALSQVRDVEQVYDVILVDEAQDFPPAFLKLCYRLLKAPKRLVYAYDELQNLSEESLPSPEEIFGKNVDGSPKVWFDDESRRDLILKKCYRNSRPVLITAHSLGFGIYRKSQRPGEMDLVQMFDHPQLWEEIGYRLKSGELKEGISARLYRSQDESPKFLEDHSPIGDLVQFIHFNSEEEQADYLIKAIEQNLEKDELLHSDLMVINPDPLTTRDKVGPIRARLLEMGIRCHLAGVDTGPDIFFHPHIDSVTFTGVHRAKGNEAGMVYIINAQECHSATWNLASIRNQLFTAITRSKAWVRVLGVGSRMKELITEYKRLEEKNFELQFIYPTKDQRQQLRIVHRDITAKARKQLQSRQKSVVDLVKDLEAGSIHIEDLDETAIAKLREILK